MGIDRKQLKYCARQALGLPRPSFRLVALVYFLATSGVSLAVSYIPLPAGEQGGLQSTTLFLSILLSLYTTVISFGYTLWSLWTYRKLNPGMGALMQGFSVAGRVILLELITFLQSLAWSMGLTLLAMLPLTLLAPVLAASPLLFVPVLAFLYVAILVIRLRFALAPYLLADRPDDGPAAAVRRSLQLTRGWTWELFKLEFSFLGWELIAHLLSLLVVAFFLWQGGFFQALFALPSADLGTLAANFSLWQIGLASNTLSSQQVVLFQLYYTIANSGHVALLSTLAILPVSLWLIPYRLVARGGFYDRRLQLQRDDAPPLPPL